MASEIVKQITEMTARVEAGMRGVRHKIGVMSGKGGVGKSTVTVNLAVEMARKGGKIGILDADINGPSVPKILGITDKGMRIGEGWALPVTWSRDIKVASMALLLTGKNTPVMWKGPTSSASVWLGAMEMSVIREFLSDVAWGELDVLLIDLPPGAGDKPVSIAQLIPRFDGVVIVTTPSQVSEAVVARSINHAKELGIPVMGIIENMSSFVCPECGKNVELFHPSDIKKMSDDLEVPFLGRVPFDPKIADFSEENSGKGASRSFEKIAARLLRSLGDAP